MRVLYLDNSGAMMLQQGSSLEVNSHDFVPRQVSAVLPCGPARSARPAMLFPCCASPTGNVLRGHGAQAEAASCAFFDGSTDAHRVL